MIVDLEPSPYLIFCHACTRSGTREKP
jgi:hypothetical protein